MNALEMGAAAAGFSASASGSFLAVVAVSAGLLNAPGKELFLGVSASFFSAGFFSGSSSFFSIGLKALEMGADGLGASSFFSEAAGLNALETGVAGLGASSFAGAAGLNALGVAGALSASFFSAVCLKGLGPVGYLGGTVFEFAEPIIEK